MRKTLGSLMVMLVCAQADAALKTEAVTYIDGDTALEGYLAFDDAAKGMRPGVLVFHEWWGMGPYVKRRADQLAAMGYVAFAPDMYGKGVYAKDHMEAEKLMTPIKSDRAALRRRAMLGLAQLRKHKNVDPAKLAAIGYCFGGTAALEMARAGADLKGVASFHGDLTTPKPQETRSVKAKVLVLQGGDDAWTLDGLPGFEAEMKKAGADCQINIYSGAVHSFTVKEAGDNPASGMAYNESADHRSWRALTAFLEEIFEIKE